MAVLANSLTFPNTSHFYYGAKHCLTCRLLSQVNLRSQADHLATNAVAQTVHIPTLQEEVWASNGQLSSHSRPCCRKCIQ